MNDYQRTLWKKKQNYLMHHGIEGQKWGKRNGPPYPLDSSISTGKKLKKTTKKNKEYSKAPTMKNMLSMDGKRESKRHIKAAILGLKALEEGDPKDKLNQWWFLNEDQTDLLPQMADLVIQGYNKKQIINLLDNEYRRVIKKEYSKLNTNEWAIREFWDVKGSDSYFRKRNLEFIDNCIKLQKEVDES